MSVARLTFPGSSCSARLLVRLFESGGEFRQRAFQLGHVRVDLGLDLLDLRVADRLQLLTLFLDLLVLGLQMVDGVNLPLRHLALGAGFELPELRLGLLQLGADLLFV